MKHPLTSKERRGLVAVAAAALLCIGSGFVFRSCGSVTHSFPKSEHSDKSEQSVESESSDGKSSIEEKRMQTKKKASKKKTSKRKTEKTYPSRSPLDEPIEQ